MKIVENHYEAIHVVLDKNDGLGARIDIGDGSISVRVIVSSNGVVHVTYYNDWYGNPSSYIISGDYEQDQQYITMRRPLAVALRRLEFPGLDDPVCEVGQKFRVMNYCNGLVDVIWHHEKYDSIQVLEIGKDVSVYSASAEEYKRYSDEA